MKIADWLTCLRIVLSLVFAYFLSIFGFVILALTDLFDGVVARKTGATRFGAWLDPFADKVFIWSYFAVLFFSVPHNAVFASLLLVLFLGDIFSTLERTIGYKAGKNVKANLAGKSKMIFQCAAAFLLLLGHTLSDYAGLDFNFWSTWESDVAFVFLGAALFSTLFSLKEKCRQWKT